MTSAGNFEVDTPQAASSREEPAPPRFDKARLIASILAIGASAALLVWALAHAKP